MSPTLRAATAVAGAIFLILLAYIVSDRILPSSSSYNPYLQLQVEVPDQSVVGQSVNLRLIVRNSSGSLMRLSGGDPNEAYEFYVYDSTGSEVWRSLFNQPISGVLANWTIAPHDQISHEATWSETGNDGQPIPPGDYTVVGTIFLSENDRPESESDRPKSPPASITLLAPQP